MELFDQVKNDFNETLRSKFTSILNENNIPYDPESNYDKDCYVTFIAYNQDINLPKKKQSKFRLSHPELKMSYSRERYSDYELLKKMLTMAEYGKNMTGSNSNYEVLKKQLELETENSNLNPIDISPMFLFPQELKVEWLNEIFSKVKHWINTIFAKTMLMYKDIHSITLAILIIEMYIENPNKLFISRLPSFQDLTFVTNKPTKIIDNNSLISMKVESIQNLPSFFKG